MSQALTPEELATAASEAVRQTGDIRSKVRQLTLHALRTRRLDPECTREVIRAVTDGIGTGAGQRGGDIKEAVSAAISGLDEALGKAAQATRLAAQELIAEGRDFTDQDLKAALDDLRVTEQALFDTLGQVAAAAGGKVRQEFQLATQHLQRTGSDTGTAVKAALVELGSRVSSSLQAGKLDSVEAARAVSARLAETASGILAGMADALRENAPDGKNHEQE